MKQAIVVRSDLGLSAGKLAAQVAHASLMAYEETDPSARKEWKGQGQKKVVLKVNGEDALFERASMADREGLPYAVVRDAGHTELDPGTVTTLGIGPASDGAIDRVTGDLSLY